MLIGALEAVVRLLAVAGAAALILRVLRSIGRTVLRTAEMAAASGAAEVSARRGDLTRLSEGRAAERRARTGRRRAAVSSVLWLAWLILPLVLGGLPEAYVVAAPLWLLRFASPASAGRTGREDPTRLAREN